MSNEQPNILLMHTDQQRFDTLSAFGGSHVRTPNLDRLAEMGCAFRRTYSANPVCMPARHDLLTGVTARHHGYYHNAHQPIADYCLPTLPRMLTAAGYQTMAVGKMHHYPPREHHGFMHTDLMEELPQSREDDAYLQYLDDVGYGHIRCQHGVRPLFYHTPQVSRVPEEHHGSAWVAHRTIELMRRQRERPFFIFSSWVGPHPPYYVPARYFDMYRDEDLPLPYSAPAGSERHCPPSPENPDADSLRMRRLREAYHAAVTLIDTHIGRILDELENQGIMDNTLIIFMSDHGEMLGGRGIYQKSVPYEGAAHIPLLAAGLDLPENATVDCPTTTWDVSATILDAAGVRPPQEPEFVGSSLLGEQTRRDDRIVVTHNGAGRGRYVAAFGSGYKYIHWFNGGDEELYNVVKDPLEQENLIDGGGGGELAAELRGAAIAFERDRGVAENVSNDEFVDEPYEPPAKHSKSRYPLWSSHQFPHWMVGYSQDDIDQIADEMRDCLSAETAYICREAQWRKDAMDKWEEIGGHATVYEELFDDVDRRY